MKKKGFTLIELLAVIAILAILLIVAIPNVIKMYNKAKKSTFTTEAQSIINTATKQYMSDQMSSTSDNIYYCYDGTSGANVKKLELSGNNTVHYLIKGERGKITEALVCDQKRCVYKKDESKGIDAGSINTNLVATEGQEGYSSHYNNMCSGGENTDIYSLIYKEPRTVKVEVHDGTSNPATYKAEYGSNKTFTISASEGNNLTGATLENCPNGELSGNELTISNITSNITCKVNLVKNEYEITYNANGGTGAPESQTKIHGTSLTLSDVEPTRTEFTFLGWSTESDAEEEEYASGGTFTTNAETTLYAVWQQHTPVACFVYTTSNNKVTITGYYDYEGNTSSNSACPKNVIMPTVIDTRNVTSIGDGAFYK